LAASIRRKLDVGSSRLQFVVSPLVWIEVNEWIAEERLKERASRVMQFTRLQREGKKRIGAFLKEIRYASQTDSHLRPFNSVAEKLFKDTTVSSRSLETGALKHITHMDLTNFSLNHAAIQTAVNLAYMQVGAADVMHLLIAAHIGCTHFATIDSDFDRVREAVEAELGLVVLFRDQILKAM
jgi:predicted nucleic acid-binding protein